MAINIYISSFENLCSVPSVLPWLSSYFKTVSIGPLQKIESPKPLPAEKC